MTRHTRILSSFIACILLMTPWAADACICHAPGWEEALSEYDAVLRGRVSLITEVGVEKQVHFEVSAAWKGVMQPEIDIWTGLDSASCGYYFQVGEEYLLAAYSAESQHPGDFYVLDCFPIASSEYIDSVLPLLGDPEYVNTPSSLCNIAFRAAGVPVPTQIITIEELDFDSTVELVMTGESAFSGVSYSLFLEGVGGSSASNFILSPLSYGPTGSGLNIHSPGGENVGFGSCEPAFGGVYVLAATYQLVYLPSSASEYEGSSSKGPIEVGRLYIQPNTDESPTSPVAATCNDMLLDCEPLYEYVSIYSQVVATDTRSFGAVKSLYDN